MSTSARSTSASYSSVGTSISRSRAAALWRSSLSRKSGTLWERSENPTAWALDLLGFTKAEVTALAPGAAPPAKDVLRRYREMLRDAHPDHGAEADGAAQRIAELTEARRILTGR